MDLASLISSTGTSISILKDLGSALLNERDRQKAAAIYIEFTEKLIATQTELMQAQSAVIAQQGEMAVLAQRLRHLEAERTEKQRYELAKLGSRREFFVYRLRPAAELDERADEPLHFLCQPCFDGGKKVVLVGNGDGYWGCPVCKLGAQVEPGTPIVQPTRRRGLGKSGWHDEF